LGEDVRDITRVIICDTCAAVGESAQGAAFAQVLRARVGADVEIEETSCMNQCDRPVALALRAQGKDVYLFHSIDPAQDVEDTLALIALYRTSAGGTIQDARPAGRLRHCLAGRVPR